MGYGLIGEKLTHSYSKLIHENFGLYSYDLIPLSPDELDNYLCNGDWQGLNVTIPYKKAVIPYCDELSERARRIGSINTLVRRVNGTVFGDNTDYNGFCAMADEASIDFAQKKVLVLGSGGTSLTACSVISDRRGFPLVISRSGENNYGNLYLHADADIIVNTTPVGMYPETDAAPLNLQDFPECNAVLDVTYNPINTRLAMQARQLGIPCNTGLTMLVAQAKRAAELFMDMALPDELIGDVSRQIMKDVMNIVLIGMPGSGKTTVGRQLARELGREFVDTDETIEKIAGMSIPDIFKNKGEEVFRQMEAEQAQKLGKESNLVIATGGGIVKDPTNYFRLKQNGLIVLLERDLHLLPLDGRPLSKNPDELMRLYRERKHLYESFADMRISSNGGIHDVVKLIRERV